MRTCAVCGLMSEEQIDISGVPGTGRLACLDGEPLLPHWAPPPRLGFDAENTLSCRGEQRKSRVLSHQHKDRPVLGAACQP